MSMKNDHKIWSVISVSRVTRHFWRAIQNVGMADTAKRAAPEDAQGVATLVIYAEVRTGAND
jgi:hypothetical protein